MAEKNHYYHAPCCGSLHEKELDTMEVSKGGIQIETTCNNCGTVFETQFNIYSKAK